MASRYGAGAAAEAVAEVERLHYRAAEAPRGLREGMARVAAADHRHRQAMEQLAALTEALLATGRAATPEQLRQIDRCEAQAMAAVAQREAAAAETRGVALALQADVRRVRAAVGPALDA